jgi:predicted ArsR family transcriptional regulator
MKRRIRTQQVVDCPKEKRVVPLNALAAGANHAQLTCRHCPYFKTATCSYVTCNYKQE